MLVRVGGAEELSVVSIAAHCMDYLWMLTETAVEFLPSVPPKALHVSYQPVCAGGQL